MQTKIKLKKINFKAFSIKERIFHIIKKIKKRVLLTFLNKQ